MGRYDVLLEQDKTTNQSRARVTGQVGTGAPQRNDFPPTPTESSTQSPAAPPAVSVSNRPVESASERANARTPTRTPTRTPDRSPQRRIITRNSFEIYEDQMESLRKLAYTEKMEGGVGSMSRMVRDAIDHYLTTNKTPDE